MNQPDTTLMVGRDPAAISPEPHVETRRVLRCASCNLNQFETVSGKCRRCHQPYPQPELPPRPPSTNEKFGRLVHIIRKSRGYTQKYVGHRMGSPRTFLTKIENGHIEPTLDTFHRLARALDLPAAALAHCYDIARH